MKRIKLNIWLRAIRFRFIASSAISVSAGIVLSYYYYPQFFNIYYALLTFAGIFCLHSSVDLLNDYWDYKRGIDLITKKTKFSGGTGVLPQKLLKPRDVYLVSIIFLILGTCIGIFFVIMKGYIIALILTFAVLSILIYSNKIVNLGLGELFVGLKGVLIVIGSFFVQTTMINNEVIWLGLIMGLLSSMILYINSIPDINADRLKGRKTLAILFESKPKSFSLFFILLLILVTYFLAGIFYSIILNSSYYFLPLLLLLPLSYNIINKYKLFIKSNIDEDMNLYEKIMERSVLFSRIFGIYIVISMILIIGF